MIKIIDPALLNICGGGFTTTFPWITALSTEIDFVDVYLIVF